MEEHFSPGNSRATEEPNAVIRWAPAFFSNKFISLFPLFLLMLMRLIITLANLLMSYSGAGLVLGILNA